MGYATCIHAGFYFETFGLEWLQSNKRPPCTVKLVIGLSLASSPQTALTAMLTASDGIQPLCRCLRPIILLLDSTPCPVLSGLVDASTGAEKAPGGAALAAADDGSDDDQDGSSRAEERRLLLAQTLVGELVLATKEVSWQEPSSLACVLLVWVVLQTDSGVSVEARSCFSCVNGFS